MSLRRSAREPVFWAGLFFSIFLGWLYAVAIHLKIDYFDSYSVLLNARAIAWFRPEEYFWNRFLLLPILYSPFFKLEKIFFSDPFAWILCHGMSVTLYALWIWTVYRLARLYGSRTHALWCAGLLATNRLVLHYAPFCRDDIPGALLATAGFYFYFRSIRKTRLSESLLAGLCWGFAMLMRFTIILPGVVAVMLFELSAIMRSWRAGRRGKALILEAAGRVTRSVFLTAGLFFLVSSFLYNYLNITALAAAPQKIIEQIFLMRELVRSKMESNTETLFFLGNSMTWPIFLASMAGLMLAWKQKKPEALPFSLWGLGFMFYFSVIIFNKEARYLFPLLPPFYYFSVYFVLQVGKVLGVGMSLWRQKIIYVFLALCFLTLPAKQALSEGIRFSNPIYTSDYAKQVSGGAVDLAGNHGKIYWAGKLYALHDRDPLFHPEDEYTYLYHVFGHTLMFYSGRWIDGFPQARFFRGVDSESQRKWLIAVGLGQKLQDGDVLVMNPEPGSYNVRNLPPQMQPLWVVRTRILRFDLQDTSASEWRYRSETAPSVQLSLLTRQESGSGPILSAHGLFGGFYEIYLQDNEGRRVWQGIAYASQQGLQFRLPPAAPRNPAQIFLLTYDEARSYPHPD